MRTRPLTRFLTGRAERRHRAATLVAVGLASATLLAACGGGSSGGGNGALQATATRNVNAGEAAERAGNFATATVDFDKVLAVFPHDLFALYDLGVVEGIQHQDAAAATHYQEVIAIRPFFGGGKHDEAGDAMYNLAILWTKSKPLQAKALYARLTGRFPNDAVPHYNYGVLLLSLGDKTAGDNQINIAVHLDPSLKPPKGA